jgi:signal transduction histidine kinase
LVVAYAVRRRSFRWQIGVVAVTAVLAVVAGVVGTARAMFLSDHDLSVVLWVVVVAGVVGLAVSAVVGMSFTRWSRSMREDARRFGESGQFDAGSRGPAELQALSDELAQTARRLQESRAREQRLEDSRRELVSWVSHDLRSPLAALRAMTEALEDGLADDPQRYHRQIRAEVDRMVRMVDDLFELSRIHAGVLALNLQPVAVGDVVSEALAGADPVARAGGVRLGGGVDDGLFVTADPGQLSRVVSNLLINAIRHTPADGVVDITGRRVGDTVELSVTDACGGLSSEDMARVFDVAWQGSPARTPTPETPGSRVGRGAGLGLAIVKGLVEAHHGQVTVSNRPPGCSFVVTLPA